MSALGMAPQTRCPTAGGLGSKAFVAQRAPFVQHSAVQRASRGALQVQSALSRQGKEETVSKLVPLLEDSAVVFGLRYQGLSVKQMQEFRKQLPAEATLLVCKNTLLKVAADKVGGWDELKPAAKGDNAWLFVKEDAISEAVKAYVAFDKEVKKDIKKEDRAADPRLKVSGGVMDGKALDAAAVLRLATLPTKQELIATIARLLNQLPTKVAVAVKQVPTKLAYGVKALADAEDNKDLVVGEVLPKPADA